MRMGVGLNRGIPTDSFGIAAVMSYTEELE